MTILGAVFRPQLPPERLRSVAEAADEAGLEELWLWEDCFLESGFSSASAALAWTERLRVGVGLFPVPLRNVALTAMEIATVDRMFPGRFLPGVGHGVQDWMGQVGARVESPLTLLREYLRALRALLDGRTVTEQGRYVRLDGVALDWRPLRPPALLAGATGPKSLRLCGELADGTLLTGGTTPRQLAAALEAVDEGRHTAGRTDRHTVAVYVHAAVGPDAEQRLENERLRWGYDTMEGRSVHGSAEQIAQALRAWTEAGATTVVVQPTADDPDPEGFVRFMGRQVAPLLR
jgi:alkanesulfonate monooxygenase SsuD/methylene tetrahydromethanopterin reductase-like flavin-dependent oxidoreductase (luciferase family)